MSVLTSATHPLIISEITVPGLSGSIGITFCPGKKDMNSRSGIWDRDLDTDMKTLTNWGTQNLVTLMEDHEFDLLGVRQLPYAALAQGLTWFHIPIRDVSVPDFRFHERWPDIGMRLMTTLTGGGRVVVHCRGGLGRSGVVAALLLIESGMDNGTAMNMVRKIRPGAIETIWQETFVRVYRPFVFVQPLTGCQVTSMHF
jgi:ADP-ribosyl-[dinitrogen reductase] hydrolase